MPAPSLGPSVGDLWAAVRPAATDGQLLTAFVGRRDPAAFAALVNRHGPMVLAVCRRVCGDPHLAEDAYQATFLVLTRRAADVCPREEVGNWLYGVAYRAAKKARAMTARRRARETDAPVLTDPPATQPPAADADALRALDDEIAGLPEHLRAAVVLCELQGRPRKEVAGRLGIPDGTLSSRLAKARKVLAGRLRRRGVVPPAVLLATAVVPRGLAARAAGLAVGSGEVPSLVARLAGGVFRAMFLAKLKSAAGRALALTALAGGLATAAHASWPGGPPAAPPPDAGAAAPAAKGAAAGEAELHVVCVYEGVTRTGAVIHGGRAAVRVDRPGKAVTLVLSGYEPVTWELTVAPKTKLTKIVLAGYHRQAVKGAPEGADVVEAFHEGREGKEYVHVPYNFDSARGRSALQALNRLTGQEVRSFYGTYRYDPDRPFVVDAVRDDLRLSADHPRVTPPADLPKVKFRAVYSPPAGGRGPAAYGDFTQRGPDRDSLKALPKGVVQLAHDPAGGKYYGLTGHEVHEVDLANRTSRKLDPGLGVPRLSWPCGVAFDTKRQRLIVATLGGAGYLYAYEPKTGAWSVLADLDNLDLAALAYHPADDALYGLAEERGGDDEGAPTLYRFNARGAVAKSTRLGAPMLPGLLGRVPAGGRVQLVSAEGQLAALVATRGDRDGEAPGAKAELFLFLLDPKGWTVKLAWKE